MRGAKVGNCNMFWWNKDIDIIGGTESIYAVRNALIHTLNFIRHLNEK